MFKEERSEKGAWREGRKKKRVTKRYLHVADIEPLVDGRVDGCSGLGGGGGDALDDLVVSTDLVGAIDGDVGTKVFRSTKSNEED